MSPRAKKAVVDISRLTGPEKAAVILLALGEDHTVLWEAITICHCRTMPLFIGVWRGGGRVLDSVQVVRRR